MFVTEEEYERYSDRWDELESEPPHTCATCAHDGQCVDLHYCGGSCWVSAESEDEECEEELAERLEKEEEGQE